MTGRPETKAAMPDYPPVKRAPDERCKDGTGGLLIHTRRQAEAGRIKARGVRIPHRGKVR